LITLKETSPSAWRRALAANDIEAHDYLRARVPDAPLPWGFIQTGVSMASLQREWSRSLAGQGTDACPPADNEPPGEYADA
jgi:hypothetical protein